MATIILGGILLLILVTTLTGIILTQEQQRGCPRCGHQESLRVLRYGMRSWWLSQFDGSIHRAQCLNCKWKGLLRN
jgi:hypothetical protein